MKRDVAKAWRWFTAEDALRWALAAYYQACRDVDPPPGDPEPESWSSGGMFAWSFHAAIAGRICAEAQAHKIACDHGCAPPSISWDDTPFSRLPVNGLHPTENRPDNPSPAEVTNG